MKTISDPMMKRFLFNLVNLTGAENSEGKPEFREYFPKYHVKGVKELRKIISDDIENAWVTSQKLLAGDPILDTDVEWIFVNSDAEKAAMEAGKKKVPNASRHSSCEITLSEKAYKVCRYYWEGAVIPSYMVDKIEEVEEFFK